MLGFIVLAPLLGFLINGLVSCVFKKNFSAKLAGGIASTALLISFIITLTQFWTLIEMPAESRLIEQTIFSWMAVGDLQLPFVLRFDQLTAIMCSIITGVGFLIHIYSIGYMSHDRTPAKFFTYLNLFCFAMLCLVLGGNLPILFLGWEGVGLCSYLLIGYWYEDDAKASAGKKAFIVNRIGDLGFLIGIFTIFGMFKTLDFVELRTAITSVDISNLNIGLLTVATTCLFIGAMGKSAQMPLYVWLPDAMAGPTPVSALIHAATMVTAGVYMIVRLNFMFTLTPHTLMLISGVGALTALFAATIAVVQTDIKKVLAYSTVSQLGFMFAAVGVGAYTAGVFHLMTHAFFKALLFLGSGSVIHGMHEEQNIMKMGGLKKHMPITYVTFVIGTLAIAGFPLLSGFFSKDEILYSAFAAHAGLAGPVLWAVLSVAAFLTAFYMTRLTCLTFLGKPRFDAKKLGHHDEHGGHGDHHGAHSGVHESPLLMTYPLMKLALLAIIGGYVGIPGHSVLGEWLHPLTSELHGEHGSLAYIIMAISVVVGLAGMGLGYYLYVLRADLAENMRSGFPGMHRVLSNKYYVDEIYNAVFVKPLRQVSIFLWRIVDVILIDGVVIGFGRLSQFSGEVLRLFQTGAVQVYGVFIIIGVIMTVGYFIYGIH